MGDRKDARMERKENFCKLDVFNAVLTTFCNLKKLSCSAFDVSQWFRLLQIFRCYQRIKFLKQLSKRVRNAFRRAR